MKDMGLLDTNTYKIYQNAAKWPLTYVVPRHVFSLHFEVDRYAVFPARQYRFHEQRDESMQCFLLGGAAHLLLSEGKTESADLVHHSLDTSCGTMISCPKKTSQASQPSYLTLPLAEFHLVHGSHNWAFCLRFMGFDLLDFLVCVGRRLT